ncbi:MAG: phenylalanine--tRNA ligase subunit beta, partial [Candidatus Baltobacteraceae bacterium]
MRVPISWLREYIDLPSHSQSIADRLASLGFPVEEIVRRPVIAGVVAGKIVALEKHPNADRLQVGTIDVGAPEALTIATAATNVAVGQVIPVARIGAQLPNLKIEPRKMRGIESQGMMCSADELGLDPEWFEDGIMQLDSGTPLGADVVALFGLADDVLDVEITSNRVDAMSVIGLARELAASYDRPLRLPSFDNPGTEAEPDGQAPIVELETPGCTRFVAQFFSNVRVEPAPAWMRVRLALAGQRPINNLVDVSNYVMLEIAQPLHFYDADAVTAHRFTVRDAREGEKLTTLDGTERELPPQSIVVADASGPLGLAGLMGGVRSEVRAGTTSIILEAANFEGARIRRASARLALRTEASTRHEKQLAPALAGMGAARAAVLLTQLGARASRPREFGTAPPAALPIALTPNYVTRLLGLDLEAARISSHLLALGCEVREEGTTMLVTSPPWRRDLEIAADLVEEVARIEGYDRIE